MLKLILFVTFLLNFQIISTIRIEPTYEIKDDFGGFGGSVIYSSYLPGQIIGIGHAVNSDDSDTDDSYRGGVDPSKIYLVSFNSHGHEIGRSRISSDEQPRGCVTSDPVAIIVHGWRGNCTADWVIALVKNLGAYRGGCILCFDYAQYATVEVYSRLARQYESITELFTKRLARMVNQGYNPERTFMFGFSFGARICLGAGNNFGDGFFHSMDLCDPAGPGFDNAGNILNCDFRRAAKNVQVIHTSRQYGTRCTTGGHQNWRMGNCGIMQPAARGNQIRSHGLCPYFYNAAFHYSFCAVSNPTCRVRKQASAPSNYCMGYLEKKKRGVRGELFALTSEQAPWNVPSSQSYATWLKAPFDFNSYDLEQMVIDWAALNVTIEDLD